MPCSHLRDTSLNQEREHPKILRPHSRCIDIYIASSCISTSQPPTYILMYSIYSPSYNLQYTKLYTQHNTTYSSTILIICLSYSYLLTQLQCKLIATSTFLCTRHMRYVTLRYATLHVCACLDYIINYPIYIYIITQ